MRSLIFGGKNMRLGARARTIYFIIPLFLIIAVWFTGVLVAGEIAGDQAQRMSRQYSIEAAANFQTYITPHISAMNQMANSIDIARWLANEYDEVAKEAAFEAIMNNALALPDAYYMFTVYETLAGYNFTTDLAPEQFVSWGNLVYSNFASQWFFDTRDAEMLFILNVQRTRPDPDGNWDLYIWTNHRIYYQSEFVGVFTFGTPFAAVYDATFSGFGEEHKRGYIIDSDGRVRIDSAGILETTYEGLPALPTVPEAAYSPALHSAIERHLQMLQGGMFPLGSSTYDAILMGISEFRYASISPIVGTDWAVLVLSGTEGILDARYVPLILVAFVLFILYAFLGRFVMQRYVLAPLNKLTYSITKMDKSAASDMSLYGSARNDEIGDISNAVMALVTEINELREAELDHETHEIQKEAEELVKILQDNSPLMMETWDEHGNFINCNRKMQEMFNIDDNELDLEVTPLKYSPDYQPCGMKTAEKNAQLIELAKKNGIVRYEWEFRLPNGEPLPVEATWVLVKHRDKSLIIVYSQDVRPIKEAAKMKEMLLNQQWNKRSKLMLDSAPILIDYWNEDYVVIDCNQYALDFFGFYSKEDYVKWERKILLETQYDGISPEEHRREELSKIFEKGYGKYKFTEVKQSGEEVDLDVEGVRMKVDDKFVVITYAKDVTAVRKLQQEQQLKEIAEQSNRAKSNFLAKMSHELRTPITSVMGISEIELKDTTLSPHTEEAFLKILSSSNSLLDIVNDILDLSRIEAEKMQLIGEVYSMIEMVADVSSIYFGFIGSKDIKFDMHVDENLPTHIVGDSMRIVQIAKNLLSNAFKYTMEGTVSLSFSFLRDDIAPELINLILSIKDTGAGMTTEQINDLTNEYARYHEFEYRQVGGTGLGMPIVFNLVKLMGANIQLDSEVGVGTTVIVTIPQEVKSDDVIGDEMARSLERFESTVKATNKSFNFTPEPMPYGSVLIVDDVEANLYVAKGLMEFYDLKVETCINGFDAIEKIRNGKVYDIVFMDHMMPELNGTEAMHQIRELGYENPIVALTANAMIGQAEEFMKEGFDGYISKPIQAKRLNSLLEKYIKEKQPPEVLAAAAVEAYRNDLKRKGDINAFQRDPKLVAKLKAEFVRVNRNTPAKFRKALNSCDFEEARHLAHATKGSAGLIFEEELAKKAGDVERIFAQNEMPTNDRILAFEYELKRVLEDIGEYDSVMTEDLNALSETEIEDIFKELEPLLKSQNADCLNFLDKLRRIPSAVEIYDHIENYDFEAAYEAFLKLRG